MCSTIFYSPPIYFHLPPYAIAKYWNDISDAAPNTDFIIYNIPQLAGVALNVPLLKEMLKNPRCIGVKNSSMPTQDIQMWRDEGAIVFNGPDEQLISGLVMGAVGGIGGTYGAMPELYVKLYECVKEGRLATALEIQNDCCRLVSLADFSSSVSSFSSGSDVAEPKSICMGFIGFCCFFASSGISRSISLCSAAAFATVSTAS